MPTLQHECRESGGGLSVNQDAIVLNITTDLKGVEVPGEEEEEENRGRRQQEGEKRF